MSEKQRHEEEQTLEQAFAELDGILETLEQRDIPLEQSFRTYQQGMELLKLCSEKIDRVEKKMQQLSGEGDLREF